MRYVNRYGAIHRLRSRGTKEYPRRASDYRLIREIGEGASAKVLAYCIPLHKHVAITQIKKDAAKVALGFDEPIVATIALSVLRGLEYLHKHSHIHRNLKASNILLEANTGDIYLADYGMAAIMKGADSEAAKLRKCLTRHTFVDTPCHMAPDIIWDQEHEPGPKDDIYAFGITLYELATGKAPYAGMPMDKVLMLVGHDTDVATDKWTKFSYAIRDLVKECTAPNPAERPTVTQLLTHTFFRRAEDSQFLVDHLQPRNVMQPEFGRTGSFDELCSLTDMNKLDPNTDLAQEAQENNLFAFGAGPRLDLEKDCSAAVLCFKQLSCNAQQRQLFSEAMYHSMAVAVMKMQHGVGGGPFMRGQGFMVAKLPGHVNTPRSKWEQAGRGLCSSNSNQFYGGPHGGDAGLHATQISRFVRCNSLGDVREGLTKVQTGLPRPEPIAVLAGMQSSNTGLSQHSSASSATVGELLHDLAGSCESPGAMSTDSIRSLHESAHSIKSAAAVAGKRARSSSWEDNFSADFASGLRPVRCRLDDSDTGGWSGPLYFDIMMSDLPVNVRERESFECVLVLDNFDLLHLFRGPGDGVLGSEAVYVDGPGDHCTSEGELLDLEDPEARLEQFSLGSDPPRIPAFCVSGNDVVNFTFHSGRVQFNRKPNEQAYQPGVCAADILDGLRPRLSRMDALYKQLNALAKAGCRPCKTHAKRRTS